MSCSSRGHVLKDVGGGRQELIITIEDGPKAKVKAVLFDGNEAFSDATLRAQLKKIQGPGFWNRSWIGGKTTFTEAKWQGDAENPRGDRGRLEDFYLKRGFVTAAVGAPRLEYVEGTVGRLRKKPAKLLVLTIPVSAGEAYRVGEVKVTDTTTLEAGRRYESRISPSVSRSTVDNPLTPRRGTSLTATLRSTSQCECSETD
jgi:outer membrane protein assembly factor BamA